MARHAAVLATFQRVVYPRCLLGGGVSSVRLVLAGRSRKPSFVGIPWWWSSAVESARGALIAPGEPLWVAIQIDARRWWTFGYMQSLWAEELVVDLGAVGSCVYWDDRLPALSHVLFYLRHASKPVQDCFHLVMRAAPAMGLLLLFSLLYWFVGLLALSALSRCCSLYCSMYRKNRTLGLAQVCCYCHVAAYRVSKILFAQALVVVENNQRTVNDRL